MKRDDPRHGTRAGWVAHRREGKKPCRPCLDANAAYTREYRSKTSTWREQQRARDRAKQRLIERHRDEFQALYVEERTNDRNAKLLKGRAA